MRIAVVGSGGREHAILWRLRRDRDFHELFALPGNGGTERIAVNIPVDISNLPNLLEAISGIGPDLVVVGPETPLADGLADELILRGIPCFGPTAAAAKIESSKAYAKRLMHDCEIPTADFEVFTDWELLRRYIQNHPNPGDWVVKADGLAAGKGAFVCLSESEVLQRARELLIDETLGSAGATVVLERKLQGREVSALFWCDGEKFLPLPAAQDYKRAEDGDVGLNTGGMGSYCRAPHLSPVLQGDVSHHVVAPLLKALRDRGAPYRGVLYVGLMLTSVGPQVIEFNCRFGDPETQAILPVWEGNLAETLLACACGRLTDVHVDGDSPKLAAVCIVLAAEGYPGTYRKEIALLDVADTERYITFHAGTRRAGNGLVSAGGRVLNAVGIGSDIAEAREQAYHLAHRLRVPGLRFRSDIARNL